MKVSFLVGGLLTIVCASAALAEQGNPSAAKLQRLGLASMNSVSDEAGMQVRGQGGEFMKFVFNWQTSAGEKASVVNNQVVLTNPPIISINDSNRASGIITDGGGINNGLASPVVFGLQANSSHQQSVLANGFTFSEISSSRIIAQVVAGNATRLGIAGVKP